MPEIAPVALSDVALAASTAQAIPFSKGAGAVPGYDAAHTWDSVNRVHTITSGSSHYDSTANPNGQVVQSFLPDAANPPFAVVATARSNGDATNNPIISAAWNLGANNQPINNAKWIVRPWGCEYDWLNVATRQVEFHYGTFSCPDEAYAIDHRCLSMVVNEATKVATGAFRLDALVVTESGGTNTFTHTADNASLTFQLLNQSATVLDVGSALLQDALTFGRANATTTFRVQGTTPTFTVAKVGANAATWIWTTLSDGSLTIKDAGGNYMSWSRSGGLPLLETHYVPVQVGTFAPTPAAWLLVQAQDTALPTAIFQRATGSTQDLTRWVADDGTTVLASVASTGKVTAPSMAIPINTSNVTIGSHGAVRINDLAAGIGQIIVASIFALDTGNLWVRDAGGVNTWLAVDGSSGNLNFGPTSDVGGGAGVIAIADAATAPTANPASGGVLYVQGGALKYRSAGGTTTTVAPN